MSNKIEMDKKSIRGWYIYDWAHSAHSTSVMVAIAPVYFVTLYKEVFGSAGYTFYGFDFNGTNVWSIGISLPSTWFVLKPYISRLFPIQIPLAAAIDALIPENLPGP